MGLQKYFAFAVAGGLLCGSASAQQYEMYPISGAEWGNVFPPGPDSPTPGSTYNMFTGVATAANSLALLEDSTAPVRDDVVIFDGIPELINPYVTAAGGIIRTVTESDTDLGGGNRRMVITVTGQTPAGGPGDLWPSGFQSGGVPLTGGGWGVGLGLPASLGGADPVNWDVASIITNTTIEISTNGVFAAPIQIPASLYPTSGGAYPFVGWNGVLGVAFGNGATGTTIEDGIRYTVDYFIPEPASLSLVAVGVLGLLQRRARR